jgi:hypothetical protein
MGTGHNAVVAGAMGWCCCCWNTSFWSISYCRCCPELRVMLLLEHALLLECTVAILLHTYTTTAAAAGFYLVH